MSLMMQILQKERDRLEKFIPLELKRLKKEYPQGSLHSRKSFNQSYLYLVYRDGQRVVSKYMGKDEPEVREALARKIRYRNERLERLKIAQKELQELRRIFYGKRKRVIS